MPSDLKIGLKKKGKKRTNWFILVFFCRGQLFFTQDHAISASGEACDDEIIDKQGAKKLLEALKRWYP